ncbi:MAG: 3-oxoacyl-ACP reductase FabG [Burkholderiaceae bacterium]|jgi:3-oxoacyl-[acyl-carrier protein] reductase
MTASIQDFSNRVVVVTGASRGIGAAIASAFAARGAKVVGTATSPGGAEGIGQALAAHAGVGVMFDAAQPGAADALIDEVLTRHGRIDVLVNNAGITRDTLAMRMKDDDWGAVLETNLSGVFRTCRAALKPMMKQRAGRMVNVTSVVGASGNPGQANYAAAKAGVAGMTRALAREIASRGITVNCVAPGFIETDMTAKLPQAQQEALLTQIPMGRLGHGSDVANAVIFLASDQAGYITGQELHVNGGMFMA